MASYCPLIHDDLPDDGKKHKWCECATNCASPKLPNTGKRGKVQVLIVVASPSAEDDQAGRLLSGRVGTQIRNKLASYDLEDVSAITSATRCVALKPDGRDKDPKVTEIRACRENLLETIKDSQPTIIVPMGAPGLKVFPEFKGKSVKDLRGRPHVVNNPEYGGKVIFFPMMHPASVFYEPRNKEVMDKDWNALGNLSDVGLRVYKKKKASKDKIKRNWKQWKSQKDFKKVISYLVKLRTLPSGSMLAYDVETGCDWGVGPTDAFSSSGGLTTLNFSTRPGEGVCFLWRAHPDCPWTDAQLDRMSKIIKAIFARKDLEVAGHNLSFDILHSMVREGWEFKGKIFCTMLANYLLKTSQKGRQGLDSCLESLTNMSPYWLDLEDWLDEAWPGYVETKFPEIGTMRHTGHYRYNTKFWDPDVLLYYGAGDGDGSFRVAKSLKKDVPDSKAWLLKHYMRSIIPYVQMQIDGVTIDPSKYRYAKKVIGAKVQSQLTKVLLRKKVRGYMAELESEGKKLNLRSSPQVAHILYGLYGLPVIKRTDSGQPSVAKDVLAQLGERFGGTPAGELIEYKHMAHLKSSFIDPVYHQTRTDKLVKWVHDDGIVHPWFGLNGTETGRRNCRGPNTMQIPSRDKIGKMLKAMFCSRWEGGYLVSGDYSQAELRVLACFCNDRNMLKAFLSGGDIHRETGALMFHKLPGDVTKAERSIAKTMNFAVIYGRGIPALAEALGIDKEEAREWLKKYFDTYPGVERWVEKTRTEIANLGYSETALGFTRALPKACLTGNERMDKRDKAAALREGVNTKIQSVAAHFTMFSLADLHEEVKKTNSPSVIVNEVHDCIVMDCPNLEEAMKASAMMKRVMEDYPKQFSWAKVPFLVDVDITTHWGDSRVLKYAGGVHID